MDQFPNITAKLNEEAKNICLIQSRKFEPWSTNQKTSMTDEQLLLLCKSYNNNYNDASDYRLCTYINNKQSNLNTRIEGTYRSYNNEPR
jgi:uncharacterized metal-binding protein